MKAREFIPEARSNPDRNSKFGQGKYELLNAAENIQDYKNWAVSMTVEPKLGINPQAGLSEDTPKGIYFYPLQYFESMVNGKRSLPWGDNFPYMQLFQYDRSGEMTRQTRVVPEQLRQALRQYCSDEIIQQVTDDGEYNDDPYWFIYNCLVSLGKGDETTIIRWNKVLRDLGFTSVYDPGQGWIAPGEPTQGVVLDPRIIKQVKTFVNRYPAGAVKRYDINWLADMIDWSSYYQSKSQRQRVFSHPDKKKVMLDVANRVLKPFLGKTSKEAQAMGIDQALENAADQVIAILKSTNTNSKVNESESHKFTTAYHITTIESAEDILYGGLDPRDGLIYLVVDTGDKQKLRKELSVVADWMLAKTERTQEPLTLLKVDVTGIPLVYHQGWYVSKIPIPANRITDLGEDEFNRVA